VNRRYNIKARARNWAARSHLLKRYASLLPKPLIARVVAKFMSEAYHVGFDKGYEKAQKHEKV